MPRLICLLTALPLMMVLGSQADAAKTTRTNITTIPPGAEVFLVKNDGERSLGLTPLKKVRLPRGTVTLRMVRAGYEELLEPITIGRKGKSFVFTMTRIIKPATVKLTAVGNSAGATVSVNGKTAGKVPQTLSLKPGRHQLVVQKDGYKRWSRWVDVKENAQLHFEIVLKKRREPTGSILIASTPSGADVMLNGTLRGKTPTVVTRLPVGNYLVELRLANHQPFTTKVTVKPKKRKIVDAKLLPIARKETGTLKVTTNVAGANAYLDGRPIGKTPVTIKDVATGKHALTVKLKGYQDYRSTIDINAKQTAVIAVELTKAAEEFKARLRVISDVPGATVKVNSQAPVALPKLFDDLVPGTHFVVVSAPGHRDWKRTVKLKPNAYTELIAKPTPIGTLKVISAVANEKLMVSLDGKVVGETPYQSDDIALGNHIVVVSNLGDTLKKSFKVQISAGTPTELKVRLKPKPVKIPARPMGVSALASERGHGTIEIFSGYPFLLGGKIQAGIIPKLALGFSFRSAFNVINEFELDAKYTFYRSGGFALGGTLGMGGGVGAEDRGSFLMRLQMLASVLAGNAASFTLRVGALYYNDRTGPETEPAHQRRLDEFQFLLGLGIEFKVTPRWNLFLVLDIDPVALDQEDGVGRTMYEQKWMLDSNAYLRLGASYTF